MDWCGGGFLESRNGYSYGKNELFYHPVDATDYFGAVLRSKNTAYNKANCSCEVQMGGRCGGQWDMILIVNKRINSDLFERIVLSFSACRIGIFTSQNGRLIVVHECSVGGVEIWIMGDVFNCQQNINHAK